jgi:hypothetical protein
LGGNCNEDMTSPSGGAVEDDNNYRRGCRLIGVVSCAVDGCDRPVHGRGLCSRHHRKCVRYGDPTRGDVSADEAGGWPSRWKGSGRPAGSIALNRFALRAVASIVAGLALGAAAVLGVTLALQQDARAAQPQGDPNPSVSNLVEYGDRCFHGHCLPQCWHGHCLH